MKWSSSSQLGSRQKRRFPEHLLLEEICQGERTSARERERYATRQAAGGAARLLELVADWEGSGWSVEPENPPHTVCGDAQWILVHLRR